MMRIATALFVLVACGDDGGSMPPVDADPTVDMGPDAMPREVITAIQALQPGELVEGIMTSGPGDKARIVLHGQFPAVSFNIHGHAGSGTQVVYEEFNQMDVEYIFEPTAQARWFLLVRNDGNIAMEVDVRVEMHGDMTWDWQ
jgi:hypothetical protein